MNVLRRYLTVTFTLLLTCGYTTITYHFIYYNGTYDVEQCLGHSDVPIGV